MKISTYMKMTETRRKHCGKKKRNCPLRAISPFPTVFSKICTPERVIQDETVFGAKV